MKAMLTLLKKYDKFLDRHAGLLFALLLVVALRIPNLAEPYWYGDEGIYLTIGQSLNKGAVLYEDIVDHKTPLIYYLARVHTQLNFRILLIGWMLVSTGFFYAIAHKLFAKRLPAFVATLLFVLLTTLPSFEGNIPNGELFVIGFVLVGGWLLLQSRLGAILTDKKVPKNITRADIGYLFAAGCFFSLGILTKVPALFDFAGFGALALMYLADTLSFQPKAFKSFLQGFWQRALDYGIVVAGVVIPMVLSVVYFLIKGAGQAYLQFGLLYNFHYAGNWDLPFENQLLQQAFTLPGKFAITMLLITGILITRKHISKTVQFTAIWFLLSLFASLLSNRPYPHYFLQVFPPACLLVVAGIYSGYQALKAKKQTLAAGSIMVAVVLMALLYIVTDLIGVGRYPTQDYYQRWFSFAQGKISTSEYRQEFNYLMTENYQVAEYLKQAGAERVFIWGTNPMLYALSDTWPASRFTVAFHIEDLGMYDETLAEIRAVQPSHIITMNKETISFPQLFGYLQGAYHEVEQTEHMTIWTRDTREQ